MSIQGSVNQLFTITGAFAGLYGQQHPEIQEGRQLKKVTSETAQQIDKGIEELSSVMIWSILNISPIS